MAKFYRVKFVTKKNGYNNWKIDVEADNMKQAKEKVIEMWNHNHNSHMFHVEVKRIKDTETFDYHWFVRE